MTDVKRLDIHNSELPVLCRACEARHRGICGALDPGQLLRLSRQTIIHDFEAGREFIGDGEPADRCANILRGVMKLTKLLPDGRQQIVGLQFAPDFLGRPFGEHSEVTAEATGTVRVCSFPRSALDTLVAESAALERRLHEQARRELDEAREWMMTLGRKTAAERVASFLVLVSRNIDPEQDGPTTEFDIPMTRADIADFLGLTVETVSRNLTGLRKVGVIEIARSRHVTILNDAALAAAAGS